LLITNRFNGAEMTKAFQSTRRAVVKGGAALAVAVSFPRGSAAAQRVLVNDASRLNPTPVARHWIARPDDEASFVAQLRKELSEAAQAKRPFSIGAARHSMGGQSIARDGTTVTLDASYCEPNTAAKTYRVNAGTRWRNVIAKLDTIGFSPVVMQSNHDFGVASTFCVNAHGWPVPYGPFGATVRSIQMMLADGTVVTCSRVENADLFSTAMGGYGLVGVIVSLEVDMVENVMLKPKFETLAGKAFGPRFVAAVQDDSVRMAYGRLSVARGNFFDEAMIVTFRPVPTPATGLPKASSSSALTGISRQVYRAQVGSEAGKRARWFAESVATPKIYSGTPTRNSLMNEPVANLAGRDRRRTDILHEYFVPPERFADFVTACKETIPATTQELLNVTLRYVGADATSVLAFAPGPRIAAVMSFAQELTPEAEAGMLQMTELLIERVIALGGSFYLPYRLHARRDQVAASYKNAPRFIERKLNYDPNQVFRNAMWDAYFAPDRK
jgi:FAD/FMN-containing dehydrogenase